MVKNETLTIRLSKENKDIIDHYAQSHGMTMAQLVKESTLEKIADINDDEIIILIVDVNHRKDGYNRLKC